MLPEMPFFMSPSFADKNDIYSTNLQFPFYVNTVTISNHFIEQYDVSWSLKAANQHCITA